MANTVIQIKRSNATATPSAGSLAAAEPAYSFNSDKLFLGNTAGTGVIEVGGKFYVDMTQNAYAQANAAYDAANSAGSSATVGAAFDTANIAYAQANTARSHANASFNQANTALLYAEPALFTANAAIITANAAYDQANIALTTGQAAFGKANIAGTDAVNAFAKTNASFAQANTARDHANAAFLQANTVATNLSAANTFLQGYADTAESDAKIYANSTFLKLEGGTVTGNLAVTGSLSVAGNTYIISAEELRVSDPLIYLAGNNYVSDIVDIGFIGNYVNATGQNVHTGFYREHEDKMYYLFNGYDAEPVNNHLGALSNNMVLAVLNADLRTSNLVLGGVNAISWITASFNKANTAGTDATNAFAKANTAGTDATNAFAKANTALTTGQAAFGKANTAGTDATNAFAKANTATTNAGTAFGVANLAYAQANTARSHANAAYDQANTALTTGQAAFGQANTNATNISGANTYLQATFSNAANITSGTLNSARLSGSYTGITGVGTLTAGTWNASTIGVPYGGTGRTTVTTNGILYGQGTSALAVTSAGTEGQVLQAGATGVPAFGDLDGGTF